MKGALNAELCRLLSRAPKSSYWRYAARALEPLAAQKNKSVRDYVFDESFDAYSIENLPEVLRNFLYLCERSIIVHYELYEGSISGLSQKEEDEKVIAKMVEDGDIQEE